MYRYCFTYPLALLSIIITLIMCCRLESIMYLILTPHRTYIKWLLIVTTTDSILGYRSALTNLNNIYIPPPNFRLVFHNQNLYLASVVSVSRLIICCWYCCLVPESGDRWRVRWHRFSSPRRSISSIVEWVFSCFRSNYKRNEHDSVFYCFS